MTLITHHMRDKTYRSDHAKQVMEVAVRELEALLKQRMAITVKVKAVKLTVKGLASLFGQEIVGELPLNCTASCEGPKAAGTQRAPGANLFVNCDIEMHKPKLERACRIALMESEQPASAGQIYDRINRRRSYQLRRYKNPLIRVIETLDMLVKDGEARTLFVGDCRCWQWNTRTKRVDGGEFRNHQPATAPQRSPKPVKDAQFTPPSPPTKFAANPFI